MSEPDYLLGRHLNVAGRLLRREMAREMHRQGLTDTMYIILRTADDAVSRGKPAMTADDLAEELGMTREPVDDAIDRLVRDGLMTELDTVTRLVAVSDKGRALLPGITDTANWTVQKALSGFSDEEIDTLSDYLLRIIANLR